MDSFITFIHHNFFHKIVNNKIRGDLSSTTKVKYHGCARYSIFSTGTVKNWFSIYRYRARHRKTLLPRYQNHFYHNLKPRNHIVTVPLRCRLRWLDSPKKWPRVWLNLGWCVCVPSNHFVMIRWPSCSVVISEHPPAGYNTTRPGQGFAVLFKWFAFFAFLLFCFYAFFLLDSAFSYDCHAS